MTDKQETIDRMAKALHRKGQDEGIFQKEWEQLPKSSIEKYHSLATAAYEASGADKIPALVEAGKGLSNFYSCIWDRVDGDIVLTQDKVEAFEKAHFEFDKALAAVKGE